MMNPAAARAVLTDKLTQLRSRACRIDAHLHETDRDVPTDSEDLAQYREDDEVVDALDDMTRDEIARVEGALARLLAGTWGTCGRCKARIEDARLEAVPTAVTCAACARAAEAGVPLNR